MHLEIRVWAWNCYEVIVRKAEDWINSSSIRLRSWERINLIDWVKVISKRRKHDDNKLFIVKDDDFRRIVDTSQTSFFALGRLQSDKAAAL